MWGKGGSDDWKKAGIASYTGRKISGRKGSMNISFLSLRGRGLSEWSLELWEKEKGENCKALRSSRRARNGD